MRLTLTVDEKTKLTKAEAKFIIKNLDFRDKSVASTWSIVSANKLIFYAFWGTLSEKQKKDFINTVLSVYEEDGNTLNSHKSRQAMQFFEKLSGAEKIKLGKYIKIQFAGESLEDFNKHLWWVPREKRLNYLKRHTPFNNALCYSLFAYSSQYAETNRGLMYYIGSEKEVLNKEELQKYVNFLINKYGRDKVYIKEAIDRYQEWLKNNS